MGYRCGWDLVIDNFESIAHQSAPADLLDFLNSIFTDLDQICEDFHVAKIETVGEEFVAAVGVMPSEAEDMGFSEADGHTPLLANLVRAAVMMFRRCAMEPCGVFFILTKNHMRH